MPDTSLKNAIISWVKEYPYWMQYAGSQLIEGTPLTKELIDQTYQFFLEDAELVEPILQRNEISFVEEFEVENAIDNLKLVEIKEIFQVNALASAQIIKLSDQLTIIYGGNGSGKSGYVRMMNNAFKGRGDKEMLPNVFNSFGSTQPSCVFTFQSGDEPYDLKFPDDRTNKAFTQFSVFDTQCVKVHLEQENSLLITPAGFEFFNHIIRLYEGLEQRLMADINSHKGTNDFIPLFQNYNAIQQAISLLSADTDIEALKPLGDYSAEDASTLEELIVKKSDLAALNIPQKILEQQALQNQLSGFKQDLQLHLNAFSEQKTESVKTAISSYNYFQSLSVEQGILSLSNYMIPELGTKQWRQFIIAAKEYSDHIEHSKNTGRIYPDKNDHCLFCQQPLADKEQNLVKTYWNFLQSEAETKVNELTRELGSIETGIRSFKTLVFDETSALHTYIKLLDNDQADKWKELVLTLEQNKKNLLANIAARNNAANVKVITNTTSEFDKISEGIQNAIEELGVKNPAAEITVIDTQVKYLADKNLLHKLLDKIILFVERQQWARNAGRKMGAFRTNGVTTKQGELFAQHITEKYRQIFEEECNKLHGPATVSISQRNVKGQTLRRLQVANHTANKVLSEGEQRAICLADFLTEVQLNSGNRGIVFDDPVTSLDHERRECIAQRLVEEAHKRQVVVFTHDIGLLTQLQFFAENTNGLNISVTSMRKQGGNIGIINPALPWVAQKVKERIGYLKNSLVKLKKIEKDEPEDDYIRAAKLWYGLLREAWERSVEERLFKGVVERYVPAIQTNRLKKLVITEKMLSDIDTGMTESSKWVHDAAAGLNPKVPDSAKAEADLTFFEEFTKSCTTA